MTAYDALIFHSLPGDSPAEKYEAITEMKLLLLRIAYPREGTRDQYTTLCEFAMEIQEIFPAETLEVTQ